jgi:hypothetical protein
MEAYKDDFGGLTSTRRDPSPERANKQENSGARGQPVTPVKQAEADRVRTDR